MAFNLNILQGYKRVHFDNIKLDVSISHAQDSGTQELSQAYSPSPKIEGGGAHITEHYLSVQNNRAYT